MFVTALAMATNANGNLTFSDVVTAWLGWITLAVVFYMVIGLIAAILVYRKAGYSHWLGVIAVAVPLIGPIFVLAFALLKWPALRERDAAIALLKKNGLSLEPPKPADYTASGKSSAGSSKELKKSTNP
jgi:ABC-type sugar transport system permease subunit